MSDLGMKLADKLWDKTDGSWVEFKEVCEAAIQRAKDDAREECAAACRSIAGGQHTQGKEQTFMAHYVQKCEEVCRALKGT